MFELIFKLEKETKNTVRFQEAERPDGPPVVGALYLQKYALKQMGSPDTLAVTIK